MSLKGASLYHSYESSGCSVRNIQFFSCEFMGGLEWYMYPEKSCAMILRMGGWVVFHCTKSKTPEQVMSKLLFISTVMYCSYVLHGKDVAHIPFHVRRIGVELECKSSSAQEDL